MAKTSPTQRTLKLLRDEGYTCAIVEKFNIFSKVRVDLFGFIDIIAIKPGLNGVLGVQTTSDKNVSARIKKSLGVEHYKTWLESGNTFEVHGWGKKGGRGKRKLWKVRRVSLTLQDLEVQDGDNHLFS